MEAFSKIGKRVPKIDGMDMVAGSTKFAADLVLPGMLWGKILRSPLPHAWIRGIDTSKAMRLPGVRAVVTGADFPKEKYGYILGFKALIRDEAPLAWDKVRYVGDAVAAVAAVDEDVAEEALDLIKVDYEEIPALFDPEESMQQGAPQIHEGMERNITAYKKFDFGDVENGFKEADYVFEDKFETSRVTHCCLMPRSCLAHYEQGRLTVWPATQTPYRLRRIFSDIFSIPQSRVRVIQTHMGAGFGGRVEPLPLDFAAILLSKKTGRPVKIVNTREEEFTATRTRHPWFITMKTGLRKDGKLLARQVKAILDGGAYCSSGPSTASWAGYMFGSLYKIPNIKFEYYVVYTNKVTSGSFRGFGTPQVWFASESQLDMIADRLNLDPVELRLKNLYEKGDVTTSGAHLKSIGLRDCILNAAKESKWKEKRDNRVPFRGIGVACMNHGSGARYHPLLNADFGTATIKLNEDGTANLLVGTHDLGQGSHTVMCQIVAEVLGIPLEDISITSGDTEVCPEDMGTFASRQTTIGGGAVILAAEDARRQVFETASSFLEARAEDLDVKDRKIFVKGSPNKFLELGRVVRETLYKKGGHTIIGKGQFDANCELPDPKTGYGNIAANYIFGCHIVEVEIDPKTGRVKVLKVFAAHDLGTALNPMLVEGQIEGSVAQGLGYALSEEMDLENGRVTNPSFLDYRIPSALDIPEIKSILVETPDPEGPFGAKGVGEPGLSPLAPAIANAIYNAVGVRFTRLPFKPDEIYQAIRKRTS